MSASIVPPSAAQRSRPETAASHLAQKVPTAGAAQTVAQARASLAGARFDAAEALFVLDAGRRLLGVVPLPDLLVAPPGAALRSLCRNAPDVVGQHVDQERVAELALRHGLSTVPVVDDDGQFLGAVSAAALLAILRREHVEDLHRLAGIARETHRAVSALDDPPLRRARHRLPWLLVGLLGCVASATLVAGFVELLQRRVQVAFFVPAIVYLADAVGTQTEAIAVRGLSLARTPWPRLLAGEVRTGLWIGAALAAVALPAVFVGAGDWPLAAAVALSILVAGLSASAIGLLLPCALARFGLDPAFGSGPLATIVQDLISIAIYLGFAQALVE
jgi:magnesium transporter